MHPGSNVNREKVSLLTLSSLSAFSDMLVNKDENCKGALEGGFGFLRCRPFSDLAPGALSKNSCIASRLLYPMSFIKILIELSPPCVLDVSFLNIFAMLRSLREFSMRASFFNCSGTIFSRDAAREAAF